MTDSTIRLISIPRTQDADGVWREGLSVPREVFAKVNSVTRAEFFDAGQRGLRAEYRFTVFHAEYQGEAECEYNGIRYSIYRTFRIPDSDDMELYVERKAGLCG